MRLRGDAPARHGLRDQGCTLALYELAVAAATTESGLLFAVDAKARAGGIPRQLRLARFAAKGYNFE